MRDCVQLLNSKIFMFPLFLNIRFVINLQMIFEPDFNFFFFFFSRCLPMQKLLSCFKLDAGVCFLVIDRAFGVIARRF